MLVAKHHPTAEEVFIRAKRQMPEISMATVYNCLDALVQSGLARQVTVDRRAGAVLSEHAGALSFLLRHLQPCVRRGFAGRFAEFALAKGFKAERIEIAIHGSCPDCTGRSK